MNNNTIIFAAGGTAGHVFPAMCVARELKKRKYNIIFATDKRGLKYLEEFKDSAIVHDVNTKSRYGLYVSLLKNIAISMWTNLKISPKIIIGFGGYPSVPITLAGQILFFKTLIHEQNAIIGKANKLLSKFANKVLLSFEHTRGVENTKKNIYVGLPTRFDNISCKHRKSDEYINILVFGGSQGSSLFANEVIQGICEFASTNKVKVFHQGRKEDIKKISRIYKEKNIEFEVKEFFDNIGELYECSDIVISRSGASTVFEIIEFQKPSILIPYAKSINGDQLENAKFLAQNDAAIMIEEKDISKDEILQALKELSFLENRNKFSCNIKKLRQKDTIKKFADIVEETLYNTKV